MTTLTAAMRPTRSHLLVQSGLLTLRSVHALIRQPWYVAITLVQPVIWLLLFGQLFRSVVHIPGFASSQDGSGSYLEFLTPGVIMMTVLFSAAWAGTIYIEDMNRGVMDRLLASPVSRGAMMIGTLAYQVITTLIQTLIVFGIAYAAGARFPGGTTGILLTLVAASLLCVIFAAMSNAVALLARTAGGADRHQPVPEPAAVVRFVSGHGDRTGSGLAANGRSLQPGRLGGGGQPPGACRPIRTGARYCRGWARWPC